MQENIIADESVADIVESRNTDLCILVTEADKHGTEVAEMSNFFDVYTEQLTYDLSRDSVAEIIRDIPMANVGILNEVVKGMKSVMAGEYSLIPDIEGLPTDIQTKLKKGIYTIGDSKQVEGNLRAVVLDENNVRVKDITLKKVQNTFEAAETVRSISNQIQMKQISSKLDGIEELQEYQILRDRDRDIVTPFLEARNYILLAQENENQEYRIEQLDRAMERLNSAITSIYTDMKTASVQLAKLTSRPFLQNKKQIDTYMGYLTGDLQMVTKFVGVQMHIYDYLGDKNAAILSLENFQHVMIGFTTKPLDKRGRSAVGIMQMNYPYNKENRDFWYNFSEEIQPMLVSDVRTLKTNDVYLVSMEEVNNE